MDGICVTVTSATWNVAESKFEIAFDARSSFNETLSASVLVGVAALGAFANTQLATKARDEHNSSFGRSFGPLDPVLVFGGKVLL